jgi:hypothetical protein
MELGAGEGDGLLKDARKTFAALIDRITELIAVVLSEARAPARPRPPPSTSSP